MSLPTVVVEADDVATMDVLYAAIERLNGLLVEAEAQLRDTGWCIAVAVAIAPETELWFKKGHTFNGGGQVNGQAFGLFVRRVKQDQTTPILKASIKERMLAGKGLPFLITALRENSSAAIKDILQACDVIEQALPIKVEE